MDKIEEYRQNLVADVLYEADNNSAYPMMQFLETVTVMLSSYDKCPVAVPCYFERIGKKNRKLEVHGYNFNDFDNTMSLFYCDYSGGPELEKINHKEFSTCRDRVKAFIEDSIDGTVESKVSPWDEGYSIAQDIRVNRDRIERYYIYILTDKKRSERFNTIDELEIDGKKLVCRLLDVEYQFNAVMETAESDGILIKVGDIECNGIPCMDAYSGNNDYQSYLCVVPGSFLAKAYKEYGSRLLESNVRSYLGYTGGTNKGIKETIQNEPQLFFAYNNGITTTCTNIARDEDGSIIEFENMQIVNGGQTTVSIYNEWKKKPESVDNVYVPMKLTVTSPEIASVIVPNISRYANSQNAVKKSDLDSNNEFQKLMERFSRNTYIPQIGGSLVYKKWYYERNRNQFNQDPGNVSKSSEFARQYDKKRKVDKVDFARYRFMILMEPDKVSKGREDCYNKFFKVRVAEKWEKDKEFFNINYYKETIAMVILYKRIYAEIPKRDWFGNRSSIKAPLTVYSTSKLFYELSKQDLKLDLLKIWDEQDVNDVVVRQVMVIARVFAEYVDEIQSRGTLITQWFKNEKCWEDVKKLSVNLDPEMSSFVISTMKYDERYKKAKIVEGQSRFAQKNNNLITKSDKFWKYLTMWYGKNLRPLTPPETKLIQKASSKGDLSNGQIETLNKLIEAAKEGGFDNPELN